MGWTTPKTWTNEPLVSTDLNTHVRDNLNYLYDRAGNGVTGVIDEGSDYTTSSNSFVNVDATDGKFGLSITPTTGSILVGFAGTVYAGATSSLVVYFDVAVDGVRQAGDDGVFAQGLNDVTYLRNNVGFVTRIDSLSEEEHTITLQWKVSATSARLYAGAGTSGYDVHPTFWVQEV